MADAWGHQYEVVVRNFRLRAWPSLVETKQAEWIVTLVWEAVHGQKHEGKAQAARDLGENSLRTY